MNEIAKNINNAHADLQQATKTKNISKFLVLAYLLATIAAAAFIPSAIENEQENASVLNTLEKENTTFLAKGFESREYRDEYSKWLERISEEVDLGKITYREIRENIDKVEEIGTGEHYLTYLKENNPEKYAEYETLQEEYNSHLADGYKSNLHLYGVCGTSTLMACLSFSELKKYSRKRKNEKKCKSTLLNYQKQLTDKSDESTINTKTSSEYNFDAGM